jgi:8-hydroxy-5-deazaflavin:NADPH oxidoreductase
MRVGILGSGLMGGKLGTIFVRAGHEVVFSYACSQEKLKKLARDAQGNARAGHPARPRRKRKLFCRPCIGPGLTTC